VVAVGLAVQAAPVALAGAAEVVAGAGMTTLGITSGSAGRLLLPAAGSAIGKLETLGEKFGVSPVELANKAINTGTRMIDNLAKNAGNINSIIPRPDGANGFVRVTLDPTGSRIISAGLQTANQVANGIESGRFTPIQ
jgi:hypothetical protein